MRSSLKIGEAEQLAAVFACKKKDKAEIFSPRGQVLDRPLLRVSTA
jgi:hypothetical protein